MQCDRAQEFFSEYLEQTLDRPMAVALEAHVARCVDCREEIEGLRAIFGALDQVAEVDPPRDGAWQVMLRLRQERMSQWEAQRRQAPSFLDWLRSLNPMSAALGAGLATMVIGGMLVVTGVPHVQNTFGPRLGGPGSPAPAAAAPTVTAAYGRLVPNGREVNLQLAVETDMPDALVRVIGGGDTSNYPVALRAGRPQPIVTVVPVSLEAQTVRVSVRPQVSGREYAYLIVLPVPERRQPTLTLNLIDQPLEAVLKQVAPALDRPVVSSAPEETVTLQVSDAPGHAALQAVAEELGATVRPDAGLYQLAPLR